MRQKLTFTESYRNISLATFGKFDTYKNLQDKFCLSGYTV